MKLGTLLLRNAAIGLSQLEAALRNQVLYGGRLGTNLVELGFIDLELLSAYLAELTGFPIATPSLLETLDPELVARLGADDAHQLRALPIGYVGETRETAAVALVEPASESTLEALRVRLGAAIAPYVVPELRALYYLEKHFGLPRRPRFLRPARPPGEGPEPAPDAPADAPERRRSAPASGMVMPPAFTLEPRRKRASTMPANVGATEAIAVTYGAACERIETASHREHIAETFVDFAKGRADALVVFLIRDGNAMGWRGYVSHAGPRTPIEQLSLPLAGASALQSAHDTARPFVGTPPSAARPVESQLWAALGANPEPVHVAVIPVLVKQRAVNLIYFHTLGGPPPFGLVNELTDLASRAQASYLRLIRQARGS